MPRKPTRKRPNIPGLLESLLRIVHTLVDEHQGLRLDVQSTRIAQGKLKTELLAAQEALLEAIAKRFSMEVPTVSEPPLGAPRLNMSDADLERQLNEAMNSTGRPPRW